MDLSKFWNSITKRLVFISLAIIFLISIVMWCPLIKAYQQRELKKHQSFIESQGDFIFRAIYSSMLRNERGHIQEAIESISGMEGTLWIRLTNSNEIIMASSKRDEIGSRCPEECAELRGPGSRIVQKEIKGRKSLLISRPVFNERSCWTASCHFHREDDKMLGRIEVAHELEPTLKEIRKQGTIAASFGFIFVSTLSLVLYLLVRKIILKRIILIAEASQSVAEGDLTVTVPITGERDEIYQLSEIFNNMVKELRKRKESMELEINGYRQTLIQAQKMEAIGLLAAGIAHDFNNLLTGIIGFSELSLLKIADNESRENLIRIIETAERGAALSRQILLIGRKIPPEKRPMDINAFINDSYKMLRSMVEERIELRTILKDDLPHVNADHNQLTQALMNLVVNARDAIEGYGMITISTDEVVIDESYCKEHQEARPGHYVVLSVRDTGSGIPDEIKDKIFNPFFTTKEKGKGTGLGLSVTYGIIASHDGWISLYSEKDKGTEFRVYLPALEDRGAQTKDSIQLTGSSLKTAPDTKPLILLVDDEEIIRDVGRSLLESLGYRVIMASNGKEAIEIYRERTNEISLIIIDLVMPVMDGESAFKEIKRINPKVKVIISSGYSADKKDVLRNTGVKGFISKPFRLGNIAEIVKKVLHED